MRFLGGRPFSSSYLAGEAAARRFLPLDFRDAGDRSRRTRAAAGRRAERRGWSRRCARSRRALPPSPARAAHLDALAAGGTAVVATGQQVGLFLGPLYGFYKAASAVAVARALAAESGVRCVPLFWLQTEDHDFAEIASAHGRRPATAGRVRLALAADAGQRARVDRRTGGSGPRCRALLDRARRDALGPRPPRPRRWPCCAAHYRREAAARGGVRGRAGGAVRRRRAADLRSARGARRARWPRRFTGRRSAAAGRSRRRWLAPRGALAAAGFDEQIPDPPGLRAAVLPPRRRGR